MAMKKKSLLLDKEVLTGENTRGQDAGTTGNFCWAVSSYLTGKIIDEIAEYCRETNSCGTEVYCAVGTTSPADGCTVLPSDTPDAC
jgi:hypothetical protein